MGIARRRLAISTLGQRLEPQRAPLRRLQAQAGQRPRRRLEDVPVAHVAVGQHVIEVVDQRAQLEAADQVDRRRRHDLVVAVDQDQQRLLDVARARPQDHVALGDALLVGQLLEHRHQPAAQRTGQHVVEVLAGRRLGARVAVLQLPARRHDVAARIEQGEHEEDALAGPRPLLLEQRLEQARRGDAAAREQVVVVGEELVELHPLQPGQRLDRARIEGQLRVLAVQAIDRGHALVAEERVLLVDERRDQDVHRRLAGDARQRRRHVPPHPDVLLGIAEEVRQRRHDFLAVADEDVARRGLQAAVAQQRHQRRHEQEVALAALAHGAHRLGRRRTGWRRSAAAPAAGWCADRGSAAGRSPPRAAPRCGRRTRRRAASACARPARDPRPCCCRRAPPPPSPRCAGWRRRDTGAPDRSAPRRRAWPARRPPPPAPRRSRRRASAGRPSAISRPPRAAPPTAPSAPAPAPSATRGRAAAA